MSSSRALPPVHIFEADEDNDDEKSGLLRLPSPPSPEGDKGETGLFKGLGYAMGMRPTYETLTRSVKACVLAAKVALY